MNGGGATQAADSASLLSALKDVVTQLTLLVQNLTAALAGAAGGGVVQQGGDPAQQGGCGMEGSGAGGASGSEDAIAKEDPLVDAGPMPDVSQEGGLPTDDFGGTQVPPDKAPADPVQGGQGKGKGKGKRRGVNGPGTPPGGAGTPPGGSGSGSGAGTGSTTATSAKHIKTFVEGPNRYYYVGGKEYKSLAAARTAAGKGYIEDRPTIAKKITVRREGNTYYWNGKAHTAAQYQKLVANTKAHNDARYIVLTSTSRRTPLAGGAL